VKYKESAGLNQGRIHTLSNQAEKFQQLLQVAEAADVSLGEDLWLIAERIMLYRLTRAGEQKRMELAAMVRLLRKIISDTQGEANLSSELVELDSSAANEFKGSAEANLSLVFTTIVDISESMNPDQLYLLISSLRKIELPKQEIMDLAPLQKAEGYLNEGFQQENEWNF
jgi:hypothetical protein